MISRKIGSLPSDRHRAFSTERRKLDPRSVLVQGRLMSKRTTSDEAISLLLAFWRLARADRPADLGVLAGRLDWGAGRVVRVLAHLERKGLADRPCCRLTLSGVAIATKFATVRPAMASRRTLSAA